MVSAARTDLNCDKAESRFTERRLCMDYNFVPIDKHPEMFIGEYGTAEMSDNVANSEYSQDTGAWD